MEQHSIKIYREIRNIPSCYQEIFQNCYYDDFFTSYQWFNNYCSNINEKDIFNFFCCIERKSDNRPLGIFPVKQKKSNIFKSREIKALSNYYSSTYSPIILNDKHRVFDICNSFVQFLNMNSIDQIDFRPMDKDNYIFQCLQTAFLNNNWKVYPYFCFGNWYHSTGGHSFEEYLKERPSKLKNTVRRKLNKLKKEVSYKIEVIKKSESIDQLIDDYMAIYLKSWKKPEPYPKFIGDLIKMAEKNDWLRFGIIYINDKPAAAQIWFVKKDTASIFKLAYDPMYSKYSVGSILTMELMKYVIDIDKVKVIDYLTGDDSYKKDWMKNRRERWGVQSVNLNRSYGRGLSYKNDIIKILKSFLSH